MRRRHTATALLATLAVLVPALASAQASKAGVVTTLEGTVTVTRLAIAPQPLKFKDDVFIDDKITTGDRSLTRMLLGGKAVVTVREHSTLTITEVPGKTTIDLHNGKLALAVAREKMRPGESVELRTPNAVAGVRGTVLIAEVSRPTAQLGAGLPPSVLSILSLLTGLADAARRDLTTGAPVGLPVQLSPMQQLRVLGLVMGVPIPILRDQMPGLLSGLSATKPQHTSDEPAKQNGFNQGLQAANTLLAGGVIGGGPITPPQQLQNNGVPPILPGNTGGFNQPQQQPVMSSPPPTNHNCHYGGYGGYGGYSGGSSSGGWRHRNN